MFNNKSWNIGAKILTGYIVIIVCLGASLLLVSSRLNVLQQETNYIGTHDLEVHDLTNQIEKLVLDMETSQRGYVITGVDAYLVPYNNAVSSWQQSYNRLTELIKDNSYQSQNLANIKANINHWIEVAGEPSIKEKREKGTNTFFLTDPGKNIIDQIRVQFDDFRATERSYTNTRIANLEDSNRTLIISIFTLWFLVAAVSIAAAILVSRNIVNSIRRVTEAIRDIGSKGNLDKRVIIRTRDEFQALGTATNDLLDSVNRENWKKDQITDIATSLQNVTSMEEISEKLLNRIAVLLNVPYGAMYLKNEQDVLIRSASYAGEGEHDNASRRMIKLGEGLVGQCALDKKAMIVNSLPDQYVQIKSGLGSASPRSLVLLPIEFESNLMGVMEIAALESMSQDTLEFLHELANVAGVSIHSMITRVEIQRLYRDSQALNEELQVQTEELRTQTDELQSQAEEMNMQTEELQNLNERLEAQKTAAEGTSLELEQSSKYKSEFLANMSHELRTPLNSMLILSQILSENNGGTLTEDEQKYASVIYSSGKDLLNLINDILDLSKVEAGQLDITLEEMNVTEIPDLVKSSFSTLAEQKGINFNTDIAENVPAKLFSDPHRLQQILKNLLSNAFKFTKEGEVSLTISKLNAEELLHWKGNDEMLAFTVRDTGIGIPEDKQALIFEAFKQADGATARKYGGTGLGLSISLQLSKLLGGDLTLKSVEGEGSTFTLYLPYRTSEAEVEAEAEAILLADQNRPQAPAPKLTDSVAATAEHEMIMIPNAKEDYSIFENKTVLVVDDDIRNVYALTSALEKIKMNVVIAQNGYESLDVLQEQAVDIILMDIMMPEMDGYQAMTEIRTSLGLTTLPIIALTAKAMKEDRDKCLDAGASDYASKPLDIQYMLKLMRFWLELQENEQSAG
ncbi:two-component system chemotaxis sensor kinase CheA [Paenibacillus shirakamiensis]|uniref:histidine kinase n=1 Tax=Paenibacillus shirakamiensis TaxID=1265935 RepID=A0ABS4JFG7_9BACL|nr:CHASE3 domain-containing protein [Paenibacillus shirakamiensis]MBP1999876.1 two-component system chemotaxis sensor kinase CheA [Paenibacillus shirakamiensis]